MAVFSANTVVTETLTIKELGSTDWTTGPEKFSRVDDSQLSSGLLKYDKYTTTFTVSANTAVYIKATFMGNLDRSSATPSESAYEAVTYEILNDSVEVEHLYNLHAEELIMKATRTATSSVTTIDLELQNLNDQTFFFTAYYEVYTFDGSTTSISGVSSNFMFGNRGVVGGGSTPDSPMERNSIRYIPIQTAGNTSVDFGNLTEGKDNVAALSNGVRGIWAGGRDAGSPQESATIDYITIATTNNAGDFGDLTVARHYVQGTSNGVRGIFAGGNQDGQVMDYITIDTTGAAADFGNMSFTRENAAGVADDTRAVFGGGYGGGSSGVIDYVTVDTIGNATDFGDMLEVGQAGQGTGDGTRGVFLGKSPTTNRIEYITISFISNAANFGDLSVARYGLAACSDGSRALGIGGYSTARVDVIDYFAVSTTGNATDFGNLDKARQSHAASSGD